jgi:hypothetical protein
MYEGCSSEDTIHTKARTIHRKRSSNEGTHTVPEVNRQGGILAGRVLNGARPPALASLNLTRREIFPTLTATLTTIAFDDSSLQRFEACT